MKLTFEDVLKIASIMRLFSILFVNKHTEEPERTNKYILSGDK